MALPHPDDRDLTNLTSEQIENLSTTSALRAEERRLSVEAEKLVAKVISELKVEFQQPVVMDEGASTSASTQVLVPVQKISEDRDSMAQVAASPSFITKHTIPVESSMVAGLEVHRNKGNPSIKDLSETEIRTENEEVPPVSNFWPVMTQHVQPRRWSGAGEFETLCDEISSAVASSSFDGESLDQLHLHTIYDKFAEVARALATFPDGASTWFGGNNTGAGEAVDLSTTQSRAVIRLPPEVQERVLRTLSEVKVQLDSVKNQLREKGPVTFDLS